MWLKCFLGLLCLITLLKYTSGYSSGAPGVPGDAVCDDLTPRHIGTSTQTTCAPFSITFSPEVFTAGVTPTVQVTITATGGTPFQGFLLTTQYADSSVDQSLKPGSFAPVPADAQQTCSNGAVTHTSPSDKSIMTFQWTPPTTSLGNIRFRATVLQIKSTYWVDLKPPNLMTDSAISSSPVADTDASNFCAPGTGPATTVAAPTGTVAFDSECGTTKGCYSDCSGATCGFLLTWAEGPTADTVAFTMSASIGNLATSYIAFGLSTDQQMGSDSVTHCSQQYGVFNSFNPGKSNRFLTDAQAGLGSITTNLADGVLTCSFTRLRAADANNERYALDRSYTIFWASGQSGPGAIGKHGEIPLISTSAVSLVDFTVNIGGSSDFPLVKAHGSLMIAAWIFAASIGIVFARFSKNVWGDRTWFGQKVWFQIHRTCMVLCLLATIIAFIIIFVDVGGYSEITGEGYKKAHPILGIIVTALTVINPIMALFRPHPDTPNRPIFNWLHWGVGTAAHTLGVITIFFGVTLDKSGAPEYMTYVLAAFVGWQFIVQILLEVIQCMGRNSVRDDKNKPTTERLKGEAQLCADAQGGSIETEGQEMDAQLTDAARSDTYEMTDMNGAAPAAKPEAERQSMFNKRILLCLHLVIVTAFAVALIIVLNIGEE